MQYTIEILIILILNAAFLSIMLLLLNSKEKNLFKIQLRTMHHVFPFDIDSYRVYIQNANDNLNFNKNLQWNIINYVVLLFAAIIAIDTKFKVTSIFGFFELIILHLVTLIGLYLTWDLQYQLRRERFSIINCKMRLMNKNNIYEYKEIREQKKIDKCVLSHPFITLTVTSIIFIGYTFTFLVLVDVIKIMK